MTEKLIVRNFGPIQGVDLEIKKTIIFIGPQSSGKSTIAKLLAIFRSVELIVKDASFSVFFDEYNISKYFQQETYFEYINSKYTIIYDKEEWVINKTEQFKTDTTTEQDRIEKLLQTLVADRYKDDPEEVKKKIISQIYENNWKTLFVLLKKQTYIPAERILTSIISDAAFSFNDISLPGCLKQFGRHFENSKIRVKVLEIPSLNITYKYEEEGTDKGHRIYFDKTHSISLSESSSGIQAVVPMQLVIENLTKVDSSYSFIVEEPELNLFPTTQKATLDYLISKCNGKNELVITTHSPYVLSVLNNLLFAYQIANKNQSTNLVNTNGVEKIIPKNIWLNPDNFNAYYFSNGSARCIINPKTKLIADNELDTVSQDITGEREKLIDIFKTLR